MNPNSVSDERIESALAASLEAFEAVFDRLDVTSTLQSDVEVDMGRAIEDTALALAQGLNLNQNDLDWQSVRRWGFEVVLPSCRELARAFEEFSSIERPENVSGHLWKGIKKARKDPVSLIAIAAAPFTYGASLAAIPVRGAQNAHGESKIDARFEDARRLFSEAVLHVMLEAPRRLLTNVDGWEKRLSDFHESRQGAN